MLFVRSYGPTHYQSARAATDRNSQCKPSSTPNKNPAPLRPIRGDRCQYFDPAKRQMRFRANRRRIDINDSRLQIPLRAERIIYIARVNRRRQVRTSLRSQYPAPHRNPRTESPLPPARKFLPAQMRIFGLAIRKHGRFVEPAAPPAPALQPMPAGRELRALVLADLHVLHHRVQLLLVDARPHIRRRIQAVANFQRLHPRPQISPQILRTLSCAPPRGSPPCNAAPLVPNPPHTAPSTARSKFASSITIMMFLPPISRWHFLNDGAQPCSRSAQHRSSR